jgi:hypothetical protein
MLHVSVSAQATVHVPRQRTTQLFTLVQRAREPSPISTAQLFTLVQLTSLSIPVSALHVCSTVLHRTVQLSPQSPSQLSAERHLYSQSSAVQVAVQSSLTAVQLGRHPTMSPQSREQEVRSLHSQPPSSHVTVLSVPPQPDAETCPKVTSKAPRIQIFARIRSSYQ